MLFKQHTIIHTMTRPGKSPSRPLMAIEDTIHNKISINVEFEFWIKAIWPVIHTEREEDLRRSLMKPVRLSRLMYSSIGGRKWLVDREHNERARILPEIYDREKKRIIQFVGEFY